MIRELSHRVSDGIEVRLLWNSETNRVLVAVAEGEFGASFMVQVAAEDALDAFDHPYAYAAQRCRDGALAA
jgi:hypothetical protein